MHKEDLFQLCIKSHLLNIRTAYYCVHKFGCNFKHECVMSVQVFKFSQHRLFNGEWILSQCKAHFLILYIIAYNLVHVVEIIYRSITFLRLLILVKFKHIPTWFSLIQYSWERRAWSSENVHREHFLTLRGNLKESQRDEIPLIYLLPCKFLWHV